MMKKIMFTTVFFLSSLLFCCSLLDDQIKCGSLLVDSLVCFQKDSKGSSVFTPDTRQLLQDNRIEFDHFDDDCNSLPAGEQSNTKQIQILEDPRQPLTVSIVWDRLLTGGSQRSLLAFGLTLWKER